MKRKIGGTTIDCELTPGDAVITGGHDLPNRHVIHCLGPVYGRDEPSEQLLAAALRSRC